MALGGIFVFKAELPGSKEQDVEVSRRTQSGLRSCHPAPVPRQPVIRAAGGADLGLAPDQGRNLAVGQHLLRLAPEQQRGHALASVRGHED